MEIVERVGELREWSLSRWAEGLSVGFVPTMGAFHDGHLSLIRGSAETRGTTIVSIFVNPTQFGPNEDFDRYPRDLQRDMELAEEAGADLLFCPSVGVVYPQGFRTSVEVEGLGSILCGASRPGHFLGVTTVVAKLLNMVMPDALFLGRKDAQQAVVLKQMVRDLDFDVEVEVLPTVREPDGLAMSSRNEYLSSEERAVAPRLFEALRAAGELFQEGERDAARIVSKAEHLLSGRGEFALDYLQVRAAEDLSSLEVIDRTSLLLVAAKLGKTRLIDNIVLNIEKSSYEL